MNVVVLVRPVNDAALAGGVTGSTLRIDDPVLTAFALGRAAAALEPGGSLTALAAGPPAWDHSLRECLAMGATAIRRAWFPGIETAEAAPTAAAIADALPEGTRLLVCGAAATDHGSGALPGLLAGALGWPLLAGVVAIERQPDGLVAGVRASGGRRQIYRLDLPAILVVAPQPSLPPYPPLARRLAAKRATVPIVEPGPPGWERGLEPVGTGPAWPRRRHLIQPQPATRAGARLRSLMSAGMAASKGDTLDASTAAETLARWLSDGGFLVNSQPTEVPPS